jgi:hypothetical protein
MAGRLTAIAASLSVVAFLVWKIADAGPQSAAVTPISADSTSSNPAESTSVATAAPVQMPASPGVLLPALPLDTAAALVRRNVFAVLRDGQQGSAFLVDSSGIVLTSAEFAKEGGEPRIQLDAERRVVGRIMSVDAARGVAALRIPIQHCRGCGTLLLNSDTAHRFSVGDSLVVPAAGTRGSSPVDARGAVSAVDGRGIQTTLRLAERSSGAPVLASNGTVRALALRRGRTQTNLVGADVLVRIHNEALRRRTEVLPNDTLVPTWPAAPVNRSLLTAATKWSETELAPYRVTRDGFEVFVMTPQVIAWRSEEVKRRIAGARLMAIDDSQPRLVDPIQRWREWDAYAGERRAVVVLHAVSDVAAYGKLTARGAVSDLRRDVTSIQLMRGDTVVRPIDAAIVPAVVNPEGYRSAGQHAYSAAVASYHPREFVRRADRTVPRLTLVIHDGRARRTTRVPLTEAALAAVERDLGSFQR